MILVLELLFMLLLILLASELFTNSLEHLGARLTISEGVTGSLLAAVGTALPETLVPLLALFAGTSQLHVNEDISVGAILGAPLMLSTLSCCLMALAVWRQRGAGDFIQPERSGLLRDLHLFLFAFILAVLAMFIPRDAQWLRVLMSSTLVLSYIVYLCLTLRASHVLVGEGHGTTADTRLWLARLGLSSGMLSILLQLILGLGLLVLGAKGFIYGVEGISKQFGVSVLLLSLLIIPIATELPEKVNSIVWVRRGKDTLALGNITGAMAFQGTLLPAMGIMFTPWQPRFEIFAGILVTLLAALWLRLNLRARGLPIWGFAVNGGLYLAYLGAMLVF